MWTKLVEGPAACKPQGRRQENITAMKCRGRIRGNNPGIGYRVDCDDFFPEEGEDAVVRADKKTVVGLYGQRQAAGTDAGINNGEVDAVFREFPVAVPEEKLAFQDISRPDLMT